MLIPGRLIFKLVAPSSTGANQSKFVIEDYAESRNYRQPPNFVSQVQVEPSQITQNCRARSEITPDRRQDYAELSLLRTSKIT